MKIAPSVLAADFTRLGEEINRVSKADYIHLDIMDGHFVRNFSLSPSFVEQIKPEFFILENVLNIIISVVLLPFPDVSFIAPSGTTNFTWFALLTNPVTFILYSTPYSTCELTPFTILCSVSTCASSIVFTIPVVVSVPFTYTFILFRNVVSFTVPFAVLAVLL